jgi:MFS family permease
MQANLTFSARQERDVHVRHNFIVNVFDGGFFGFALGVASFITVIPLFISQLTDSTVLIGLVASLHSIGWQLPQLLTARKVAGLRRYKRMVLLMTLHERWPFFPLALLALALPSLNRDFALVLAFILITWQSFGGGFTATAWQSMIAKLIPPDRRGIFYGTQSGLANLMSSGGAVLAGAILGSVQTPNDFALCFFVAGIAMVISGSFLASTRESESSAVPRPAELADQPQTQESTVRQLLAILRRDGNFRWFLLSRGLVQYSSVAVSFFTIFAVRRFEMDPGTAGVLTGVLLLGQTIASPIIGWLGDRFSYRSMFIVAAFVAAASAAAAWFAPNLTWMYPAFLLAGVTGGAMWTMTNAIVADFGTQTERPYYIGLTNTLIAPVTLLAPLFSGWLADVLGFEATFGAAAIAGLLSAAVLILFMVNPRRIVTSEPAV